MVLKRDYSAHNLIPTIKISIARGPLLVGPRLQKLGFESGWGCPVQGLASRDEDLGQSMRAGSAYLHGIYFGFSGFPYGKFKKANACMYVLYVCMCCMYVSR